jgi:hypothetical protein
MGMGQGAAPQSFAGTGFPQTITQQQTFTQTFTQQPTFTQTFTPAPSPFQTFCPPSPHPQVCTPSPLIFQCGHSPLVVCTPIAVSPTCTPGSPLTQTTFGATPGGSQATTIAGSGAGVGGGVGGAAFGAAPQAGTFPTLTPGPDCSVSSTAQFVCAVSNSASVGLPQLCPVPEPTSLLPAAQYSMPECTHSVRQSSATLSDPGQPCESVLHSADHHPDANLHANQSRNQFCRR